MARKRSSSFENVVVAFSRQRRKKLINDFKSATQPGKTADGLSRQRFELSTGEAFGLLLVKR